MVDRFSGVSLRRRRLFCSSPLFVIQFPWLLPISLFVTYPTVFCCRSPCLLPISVYYPFPCFTIHDDGGSDGDDDCDDCDDCDDDGDDVHTLAYCPEI